MLHLLSSLTAQSWAAQLPYLNGYHGFARVSWGEGDICPLPQKKIPVLTMWLLHWIPDILLAEIGAAPCGASEPETGFRMWRVRYVKRFSLCHCLVLGWPHSIQCRLHQGWCKLWAIIVLQATLQPMELINGDQPKSSCLHWRLVTCNFSYNSPGSC